MESEVGPFTEQSAKLRFLDIKGWRERRRIQKEVRDFDLATRDGRDRELGWIEECFGVKFRPRPRMKGVRGFSCHYHLPTNTIELQSWMTRSEARYAVWHEGSHGLCEQDPSWKEFTKETLEKTRLGLPDKYPEAFLMLRDSVLEEGIVDVAMHFALKKIFPYMEKWEREGVAELNNNRLRPISGPRRWLRRLLAKQEEIEKAIARTESYPQLPAEDPLSREDVSRGLKRHINEMELILLLRNFSHTEAHRIGANFVFRLAKEQGLETIGEIIQAVTDNPPESWEELLGMKAGKSCWELLPLKPTNSLYC